MDAFENVYRNGDPLSLCPDEHVDVDLVERVVVGVDLDPPPDLVVHPVGLDQVNEFNTFINPHPENQGYLQQHALEATNTCRTKFIFSTYEVVLESTNTYSLRFILINVLT